MLLRFKELTTIAEREDAKKRLRSIRQFYFSIALQIANLWAEHIKDPEMQKESQALRITNDAMIEQVNEVLSMLTENNYGESVPDTDS